MKKSVVIMAVLPLLISMFFFSVGFASWTVLIPVNKSTSVAGGLSSENVYNSTDYITAKITSVFNYSSLHFLDSSSNKSRVGSIIVTCTIDIDSCKERLNEKGKTWDGSLDVHISLSYSNTIDDSYPLFAELNDGTYYRNVSSNFIVGQAKTSATTDNKGVVVHSSGSVSNLPSTGEYTFGVEFVFDIPQDLAGTEIPANFRHCFGQYLKDFEKDKTEFIPSARVIDVE